MKLFVGAFAIVTTLGVLWGVIGIIIPFPFIPELAAAYCGMLATMALAQP